jgi:hypothetical protein
VEGESAKSDIVIEPFVLPPQSKFSSSEAHARASGPNKWNRQQGFYIYRADRMIQSGGWSNIRTLDEHLKLARVALSFNPRIDDAFKINVAKMRVALPVSVRDEIADAISPLTSMANKIYRNAEKGGPRPVRLPVKPPAPGQHDDKPTINVPAGRTPPSHDGDGDIPPSPSPAGGKLQNLEVFGTLLLSVARPDEQPVVERVLARARAIERVTS